MAIKQKKDVGTGLDSRPCLVSIIFADLPSLHTLHFIEMIFILVYDNLGHHSCEIASY